MNKNRSPRGNHTWVAHGGKSKTNEAKCARCQTVRKSAPGGPVYTRDGQTITERPVPCNNN